MKKFLSESIVVCAGGAFGALVRSAVGDLLATDFILAIFICNVLGCYLFALYVDFEKVSHPHVKKFHTVGICGGLTTFSTFSLQVAYLARDGNYSGALLLFFGTFAACLLAAVLCRPTVVFLLRKVRGRKA